MSNKKNQSQKDGLIQVKSRVSGNVLLLERDLALKLLEDNKVLPVDSVDYDDVQKPESFIDEIYEIK